MPTAPRKAAQPRPTAAPRPTSVSEWKKTPDPIELPSGKFIVVKPASLTSYIQTGQIPNSLMSVIQSQVNSRKKANKTGEEVMSEIVENPDGLRDLFSMVDRYVCLVALEPRVYPVPELEDRDPDRLYVDELDASDKMYLFQRSMGGTTDLESFRRELAAGLDLVQQREDVVDPPQRAPRRK